MQGLGLHDITHTVDIKDWLWAYIYCYFTSQHNTQFIHYKAVCMQSIPCPLARDFKGRRLTRERVLDRRDMYLEEWEKADKETEEERQAYVDRIYER